MTLKEYLIEEISKFDKEEYEKAIKKLKNSKEKDFEQLKNKTKETKNYKRFTIDELTKRSKPEGYNGNSHDWLYREPKDTEYVPKIDPYVFHWNPKELAIKELAKLDVKVKDNIVFIPEKYLKDNKIMNKIKYIARGLCKGKESIRLK